MISKRRNHKKRKKTYPKKISLKSFLKKWYSTKDYNKKKYYLNNLSCYLLGEWYPLPLHQRANNEEIGFLVNLRIKLTHEINKDFFKDDFGFNKKGYKKNKQKILKFAKQEAQYCLEDPDFENYFFYDF